MLLAARWVVPVSSPPIENGAVLVENDRISSVGKLTAGAVPTQDLGDAVIFPGLVNAHCHLEFSHLKGMVEPGLGFTEWARVTASPTLLLNKEEGYREEVLRGGTTTLADHCHPDTPPIETPLRRVVFWEVLGANENRARQSLAKARERAAKEGGFVSPHSLYAVHEEVLEEIFRDGSALRSIHILESSDEDQFFRKQSGPLAVYVQERGGDLSFPMSSPIKWLAANHWLGSGTLIVHGNYLDQGEIALLRETGAGVIHCPGSHRFFGHKPFPLQELRRHGVRVALGTDSLASNEDLSMLREMRLMENAGAEDVLTMATMNGARMLGMEKEIGSLEAGKKADIVAVKISDLKKDPFENIRMAEEVCFSMIDGKIHV